MKLTEKTGFYTWETVFPKAPNRVYAQNIFLKKKLPQLEVNPPSTKVTFLLSPMLSERLDQIVESPKFQIDGIYRSEHQVSVL